MDAVKPGSVDAWLLAACADAERRGLAELKPLLEGLARSTTALREADRTVRDRAAMPGALDPEDASARTPGRADTTE